MKNFKKLMTYVLVLPFLFAACQEEESPSIQNSEMSKFNDAKFYKVNFDRSNSAKVPKEKGVKGWLNHVNLALEASNLQIEKIEFMGMEEAGNTVFFDNRGNKQLSSDYVPNDPRNWFSGTDLVYWIDGTELGTASGMTEGETESAIINTMNTWDAVGCSDGLGLFNWGTTSENDFGDVGLIQAWEGLGGSDIYVAPGTILHAGITSPDFFEAIFGPSNVIGVTFTLIWIDGPGGDPTDIDNNGKNDVAVKEIYINNDPDINWQDEPNDELGNGILDFETVVLHEVGHGLSQGHFGKAFANNGGLHFAPYALMNAGYTIGNRMVTGTDEAGHCSNWESWPEN